MGTGSDGGTTRAPKNGPQRAGDRRSGRDGGRVYVRNEAGGFEFRRAGHVAGRGESSGCVGAATGWVRVWGGNKNQHQRTGAGCAGILSGHPGASIVRWGWFGGTSDFSAYLVHTKLHTPRWSLTLSWPPAAAPPVG
jgi:hypothetical protein